MDNASGVERLGRQWRFAPSLRVRTVRSRLLLLMLAATLTALLVAGLAMMFYDLRDYKRELLADLSTQAEIVGQASVAALAFDDPSTARLNLELLKAKPSIIEAAIFDSQGVLFALYARRGVAVAALPVPPQIDEWRIADNEVLFFRGIADARGKLGTIYLKANYELYDHLRYYLSVLGLVLGLSLLIAFALAVWLQQRLTTPLLAIRDVARDVVEKRDFSLRAPRTTDDEIGYVAEAFNRVLAEIENRASELERSNRTLEMQIGERERAEGLLRTAQNDLRRLNAELEQRVVERTAQLQIANKELESFSYSVSHDLRAPVRAIAGFSRLLAESHQGRLDAEGMRKLDIVRSEAARMGELIDDLLALSRLGRQSLQKGPVDMKALVRATCETLRSAQATPAPEVEVGELPVAHGDRSLLAQVWMNLLSNAFKFSSAKPNARVEVGATSDESGHTYFVRDNGAGFDPRYTEKLFGVFQRLHSASEFPGTGVGLALVQRIVTRHGGRVRAESRLNEGATFYFTLPRSEGDGRV